MNSGTNALIIKDKSFIFLLIAGLLFSSILPMPVLGPILILLFGLMIGLLIISISAPEDFNFLFPFYIVGFALRIFLSFLFYTLSFFRENELTDGFLFLNDGWTYSLQGWQIFELAERGIKITPEIYYNNPNMITYAGNITPYDYFTSFVYSMVGYSPISLFFISSLMGTLVAVFVYLIAKELFSKKVAMISSLFAFFWPSFIMWSTQNLKEPMIAMLACILIWSVLYMYRYLSPGFLLLTLLSGWALFKLSFPYVLIIVAMIFFARIFLFGECLFKNKFIVIAVIGSLVFLSIVFLKDKLMAFIAKESVYSDIKNFKSIFEFLDYHRAVRSYGRLQFLKNTDISSFGRAISFAPLGLLYAIFAPFPWQIGSITQIIVIPETLAFYILFPFTLKGVAFAYKNRFRQSISILSIIAAILIFLALVEGNSGTLFRHRFVAFNLLFIFTAIGIALKKPRRNEIYTNKVEGNA